MKHMLIALSALMAALAYPGVSHAEDRRQGFSPLAVQQHCDECHSVREVNVGPPFRAVAMRYAEERDAATERLAYKIINGGAGNWGTIPMVPNERISLEDARAIARWILSLQDTK